MPNFTCQYLVEGVSLDFCFSLIYYPGGTRYWIAVNNQEAYVTSFYFEKNSQGSWKLADRYQTAPVWVRAMEPLLTATINSHKAER